MGFSEVAEPESAIPLFSAATTGFLLKRPWLLTQTGKKASLHIANVLSLMLFAAFALQYVLVEQPRTQVPQLDTANVSYCQLSDCQLIFGVELTNGSTAQSQAVQTPIGVQLDLEFTNLARYQGKRQLWIRMETPAGEFVEAASTWVDFSLKNHSIASFTITGTLDEIRSAILYLGY